MEKDIKEINILPILQKNDYLTQSYEFWKSYRENLYLIIKEQEKEERIVKTSENIVKMAEEIGIKATGRYFNILPSSVRYHVKKVKGQINNE